EGAKEGYAEEFQPARIRGFADAYPDAYEAAYLRKFRKAGLKAPTSVSVPDPGAAQGAEG
ncbi:MAG: hypothetical protein WBB30_09615, partial [Solirubrobacterales bacterium]